ncbi:E3 SUMO-protein ligase ZBED1-like [Odontesthes bonariensis]|uniref:E3 SUMO-protein ligase ZBED1-like n=1 Tax=Odontesthes bonariensis TaxID=219752 RepID=UPI003F586CE6
MAAPALVPKQHVTSPIWEHFGFQPNEKGEPANLDEAVCKICFRKLQVKRGNTSNLRSHLASYHPAVEVRLPPPAGSTQSQAAAGASRQLGVAEAFARAVKYGAGSERHRGLTDAVARYLVEEMVPFNTVEKPSFRALLNKFDRQYELPGKTYFSQTAVPKMYSTARAAVQCELREVDFFSATTDMWSSVNMTPYMTVTVHFLASDWTLKTRCLETVFMPQNHTAENIAEALHSAFDAWSLDQNKLACITTDNGANIVAAVRKLQWTWLNCFGHNLHLAVTNAMASVKDRTGRAMGLCHSLVSAFSQSWPKRRDLAKAQAELQAPQHGLIMDCPTRWGSKQRMVERVLEQTTAIQRVLVNDRRHQHLIPSWQDIAVLQSVNAALKPAAEFTDLLSGEAYVTVSSIKPVLKLLTEDVLKPSDDDTTLTADIKRKMCSVLDNKYSPILHKLLEKACLLDPRYRGKHFDWEEAKCALIDEMLSMGDGGSGASPAVGISVEQTAMPPPAKKRTLGDLLKAQVTTSAAVPMRIRADSELTHYLQEEPLDSNADPLAWWREKQFRFPLLSKIARKYMCICATSAPSERVFSTAGSIVTHLRSSLKPEKVNMLVFLARNKDI